MASTTWYLAPALARLREQINAAFPGRDKSTDGAVGDTAHQARPSDHNPDWNAGGIVRAIDVDEDLWGPSTVDKGAVAQALVDAIITDPRVAYVIYEGRIWQNPAVFSKGGWQPYTSAGKSGWFNPHKMHFHVSIRRGATWDADRSDWPIPARDVDKPTPAPKPTPSTPAGFSQETLDYQRAQNRYGKAGLVEDGINGPKTQTWRAWVERLQHALNKWAAVQRIGRLQVDGDYRAKTDAAVYAVQKANPSIFGRPDRVVGPKTIRALGIPVKPDVS